MKKKTKTYLLLTVVVIIWGIVGFKIITTLTSGKDEPVREELNIAFEPENLKKVDTFSIDKIARDPFLGQLGKPVPLKKNIRKSAPIPSIEWLPISYHGVIKKDGSNEQVFLLTVNNKQYLLQIGHSVEEVTLEKGNAEEIVIIYKGYKKTILIQ